MDSKPSLWKIFLCTFGLIGVSITWTLELSYGTPFLLSLNLSRELTALVWLAGPLSGIIVQPLIGAISDNSTFRLGKRRPFIIVGGIIVLASLLAIAFSHDLASLPTSSDSTSIRYWTIVIVVISFYTLDFSLNAVQASCRFLVVDTFCLEQQDTANALASNLGNFSNVLGYMLGYTDLTKHLPSFLGGGDGDGGSSQIKALFVIGTLVFGVSVSVTCIFTTEKRPARISKVSSPDDDDFILGWCRRSAKAISNTVKYMWQSGKKLPTPMKRLCLVQFFAWMGWFPFLFYSTTWVSGIYYQEHPPQDQSTGNWEDGTRAGSFALLVYAIVSVACGTILPWATSKGYVPLKTVYTCSHLIFAVTILCTHWAKTVAAATAIIGIVGISWSCNTWIPFVFAAKYISYNKNENGDGGGGNEKNWDTDDDQGDIHSARQDSSLKSASTPPTYDIDMPNQKINDDIEHNNNSSILNQSANTGIALGIMNVFTALPQCVVALIAYVFFDIRQKDLNQSLSTAVGQGVDNSASNDVDGVAWLMVFGSWMALIAAGLTRRLLGI